MENELTPEELEAKEKEEQEAKEKKSKLSDEYKELLQSMVDEQLKDLKADFKTKIDKAYKQLEEEKKEKVRIAAEAADAKKKKLEEEGNHLELAKLKLAEVEERNKILEEKLTRTSRDGELNRHLAPLDFRNDFARSTAFSAIVGDLVQDEDGLWVHKSGAPLADYVKAFAKDPDKSFLFKAKENSGAGSSNNKGALKGKRPDSIIGMSTEDILKLVESGQLGGTQNY